MAVHASLLSSQYYVIGYIRLRAKVKHTSLLPSRKQFYKSVPDLNISNIFVELKFVGQKQTSKQRQKSVPKFLNDVHLRGQLKLENVHCLLNERTFDEKFNLTTFITH